MASKVSVTSKAFIVPLSLTAYTNADKYNSIKRITPKEVQIEMIGLSKLDVITIFRRYFKDVVIEDSMINSVAMAVGEVVEENNKRLFRDLKVRNSNNKESG